jgi:photosystem II stability/assembly factor-like uncharacterized protein
MKFVHPTFFFILFTELCFAQWFWQNPLPQGNNLYDICDDANHPGRFFAVGDQGTILRKENIMDWQIVEQGNFDHLYSVYFKGDYGWAVGYNGTILQNIDGLGNTWYPLSSGTTKQLLSVFFFDQLNGWIVGQDQTVLKTTDGGTNWNSSSPTGSEHYFSVYFTSLLNGWIAGSANQYGVIKKTTDGGATWTNSLIPTNRMNSIRFVNENIGCVVGDDGKIYTTSNAGTNWNLAVSNTTSDLQDFYMSASGEGRAVGYDGTIIHTTDFGSNWSVETSPTTQTLYAIENDHAVGWAGTLLHRDINWEIVSEGFTNNLTGTDFADADNGWVVGWEGVIYHTTDGGDSWIQQNSGTNKDLLAVDFITNYSGMAVGKNGTVLKAIHSGEFWIDKSISTNLHFYSVHRRYGGRAWVAGEFGNIWKTTDYGDNWVLQHENTGYHLYSIHFVHKNYGWAAGMSGAVLKTTNGGDEWIDVSPNNLEFFRSIYFIDRHIGWVVGVGGAIYSSTDGGNNWTELLPKVTYETLNKVVFVNESDGWIVGDAGTIFITTNGGVNWYQQNSPGNAYFTSASFPETGLGWICGWDGAILHTTDGGGTVIFEVYERNGLNLYIPDPGEVTDVIEVSISPDFLDDYTLSGVTVILDSVIHPEVSDLAFLLTHDGITDTLIAQSEIADSNIFSCKLTDASSIPLEEGESPYEGNFRPHNPLSIFSGMDPNGEWTLKVVDLASGNSGILQSWGLKLFFDAPTNIELDYSSIPYEFQLYQNYPNPFNPSTKISYLIPASLNPSKGGTLVTLKVYDLLGSELATLVNEEKSSGTYEVEFDAEQLSSGIYFYQLKAGDFIQTKKMVLLK